MIVRYSLPEMRGLWAEDRKYSTWLEIEILACEAMADFGFIPAEDARTIRENARIDIPKILEIEKVTNHDVIAFLENVASYVGPASRWIHQGLTSSDILDTTLAVQMKESCRILDQKLEALMTVTARRALEFKMVPMIGRSHGVHAEPVTFGLKLALMHDEFRRARQRLSETAVRVAVGKLSGAVGTRAHLDPRVENQVCEKLGLKAATLATQVVQRDRHAEFLNTLALIGCSVDRWATEFRHLQRTEVREVEEYFSPGQKGSSAMPHKRNPITGERLSGLARVLRGNAQAGMENVALWHERDISHSSVERIVLPDSCTLLDYMLHKITDLVDRLLVYPDAMERNMSLSKGLYNSQTILLALTRTGIERKTAYEAVQRAAMRTWETGVPLPDSLKVESEIMQHLSESEIDALCSLEHHFRHVDSTFAALGIE